MLAREKNCQPPSQGICYRKLVLQKLLFSVIPPKPQKSALPGTMSTELHKIQPVNAKDHTLTSGRTKIQGKVFASNGTARQGDYSLTLTA